MRPQNYAENGLRGPMTIQYPTNRTVSGERNGKRLITRDKETQCLSYGVFTAEPRVIPREVLLAARRNVGTDALACHHDRRYHV